MNETTVVNKYKESYDVYGGRGSIFGNPMGIGTKVPGKPSPVTREESIIWYKQYFYARLKKDPYFKGQVLSLKGKRVGCFCKPKPCHLDVIVEYLNAHERGEVK